MAQPNQTNYATDNEVGFGPLRIKHRTKTSPETVAIAIVGISIGATALVIVAVVAAVAK